MVANVTYTVTALSKDALYEFRVAAENRAGVGPSSDPTETRAKTPVCEYSDVTRFSVAEANTCMCYSHLEQSAL